MIIAKHFKIYQNITMIKKKATKHIENLTILVAFIASINLYFSGRFNKIGY